VKSVISFLELIHTSGLYPEYNCDYYFQSLKHNLPKDKDIYDIYTQINIININKIYETKSSIDINIPKYINYFKDDIQDKSHNTEKVILFFKFDYNINSDQGIYPILFFHIDLLKWYFGYSTDGYANTRGPLSSDLDIDIENLDVIFDKFNSDYLTQHESILNDAILNKNPSNTKLRDILTMVNSTKKRKIIEEIKYKKRYNNILQEVDGKINHVLKAYAGYPEIFRIIMDDHKVVLIPDIKSYLMDEINSKKKESLLRDEFERQIHSITSIKIDEYYIRSGGIILRYT
jgi:hypothetical protein